MGTANGKPPFGVPTIFVGTIVPTNLSEQPIGIQFPVPTILVETVLFPQSLWEHQGVYILQMTRILFSGRTDPVAKIFAI